MPATKVLISACAPIRGSGGGAAAGVASKKSDPINAMSSDIPHPPSPLLRWSRRGPAATGRLGEWLMALWLAAAIALDLTGCGATYRAVRPSEPVATTAGDLRVDVQRLFLTEDTIENGLADGAALVVELTIANGGVHPYSLKPTALWCLMQVDARRPDLTRLLPPSMSGDGTFPGAPPKAGEGENGEASGNLSQIDVAPGQTRSFWVLFRGYQFAGSELPRRITLTMPDGEGRALELVLGDPARGLLRWEVPPTPAAWYLGVEDGSLSGSYARATSVSSS